MDEDYKNDDDNNEETESEDENMDVDDIEQKKPGQPKKEWDKSSKDSKNRKTDELMAHVRETAKDLGISVNRLILFLGKRDADINGDNVLSKLYQELNRNG